MHKLRIYIDTSVIGGCFDIEFAVWSNKLFDEFINGDKIAVISETTLDELNEAPLQVKLKLKSIPIENIEILQVNNDIEFLAKKYIELKAIPEKCYDDSTHIAYASFSKVDYLVSWNFKHIVNVYRIQKYNSINLMFGYKILDIRTPREVILDD